MVNRINNRRYIKEELTTSQLNQLEHCIDYIDYYKDLDLMEALNFKLEQLNKIKEHPENVNMKYLKISLDNAEKIIELIKDIRYLCYDRNIH